MAQSLALMAAPAAEVAEVGGTFKRQKPGQNLGHERLMPESVALAMRLDCFMWGETILEDTRHLPVWE
jgi:hypothetical protein